MKSIILVPLALSLMMGTGIKLADIAEATSDKVIAFSDEMNSMVDCAFVGAPLEQCSKEFHEKHQVLKQDLIDFKDHLENVSAELQQTRKEQLMQGESVGVLTVVDGNTLIWGVHAIEVGTEYAILEFREFDSDQYLRTTLHITDHVSVDLDYDTLDDLTVTLSDITDDEAHLEFSMYKPEFIESKMDYLLILGFMAFILFMHMAQLQRRISLESRFKNGIMRVGNIIVQSKGKNLLIRKGRQQACIPKEECGTVKGRIRQSVSSGVPPIYCFTLLSYLHENNCFNIKNKK